MMNVSVIIPTYKDWPRLRLCLEALSKQTYPHDQFEVIVVNNDPGDNCPFLLPAANMKIIDEAKPGSYAARNAGIIVARGDILAFTDSDCIPNEEWICSASELFSKNDTINRIAGKILIFQDIGTSSVLFLYQEHYTLEQEKHVKNNGSALTANLFVRKNVFVEVGMFREDLYSGGDNEWGIRANSMKVSIIYSADVVIRHPSRKTLNELLRKRRRTTGGNYLISFGGQTFLKKLKVLVRLVLPPVYAMKKINEKLSVGNKIILFLIIWIHKIVEFSELIMLSFVTTKPKRV